MDLCSIPIDVKKVVRQCCSASRTSKENQGGPAAYATGVGMDTMRDHYRDNTPTSYRPLAGWRCYERVAGGASRSGIFSSILTIYITTIGNVLVKFLGLCVVEQISEGAERAGRGGSGNLVREKDRGYERASEESFRGTVRSAYCDGCFEVSCRGVVKYRNFKRSLLNERSSCITREH